MKQAFWCMFSLSALLARSSPISSYQLYETPLTSEAEKRSFDSCLGNTPETRQQWCNYDINTDYTTTTPDTGVTREFWLELDQVYIAPDGRTRWTLAFNGSVPGPTLEVNWGDTVIVHLHNKLPATARNGTSIHFHGIRQYYSNPMDGVVSITQCPLAPGHTMTYRWRATQYGTTWYHSHIGLQTWEGAFGGIIINGPASANYDEDKGVILLSDWDARTVDELWDTAQLIGSPMLDNGLINGVNVFGEDEDPNQTGFRFNISFEAGKSYRLRLGNAACDTLFSFSVDHHLMTVIATDLVPIKPYTTSVIYIAIGQRYDIIIHANESTDESFWMRAIPQKACSTNSNANNIRGIVYYNTRGSEHETPPTLPITTAHNSTSTNSCTDEKASNLIPIISQAFPDQRGESYNETLPATVSTTTNSFYRWQLNGTSMYLNWSEPTLRQIHTDTYADLVSTNKSPSTAVIAVPHAEEWVLVVIETSVGVPHPIHLHGHDFLVVAQGPGRYEVPGERSGKASASRNGLVHLAGTLPKRDTALLPAWGHLALAFRTDNPGAWLLHCHIGWHLEQGFALQFVEREAEIKELLASAWADDMQFLSDSCAVWSDYAKECAILETGSGV
ncbi:hypothetical protein N7495_009703 [Penicillium taxi]|uniref:uncharacterized protein n=1 Tax=Penicillium taxi TaxID=168475 RepID=UPI002544F913|nr:uncharacterized protein N7495_009703 [Penicillium taxi]KAJ5885193.1 hypothetical protein N7495_009703 [Penicillium taxi]